MAWLKSRTKQDGTVQYTGMYRDLQGHERSAGTHTSKREALRKAAAAESQAQAGKVGDPKRGRQTLRHYVEHEWLPNHVMEDSTRESYTYVIERHILGPLGRMRLVDIMPWHIRDWITELAGQGVRAPTIRSAKVCLDAVLSTAFHDQITALHAGRGVKTPSVARKPVRIITAEHYQRIHDALDNPAMQLLVETAIETGLRWGELTELRPHDIDLTSGVITVARAVVQLKAATNTGPRFRVKDYPKDAEWRHVSIAPHLVDKLRTHIATHDLGPDALLFSLPHRDGPARRRRPAVLPDPTTLGMTQPNEHNRSYRHGTLTAYQAGRCRCEHCRDATATYRATRRAAGRDTPRVTRTTSTDADRHLSNDWFRHHVWNPALTKADLGYRVTPHGLRHAHASWLLAGGADHHPPATPPRSPGHRQPERRQSTRSSASEATVNS
ncbi:MAG: tyrosine-type recombinase/integrase family protein [Kineosporiaceae bacterium]|nr:tyrosine-type recombinase/integrase family protein [Kineosporiaceae bacterium]